jgi:alginate O-acetyltransferase complex protein AlgI
MVFSSITFLFFFLPYTLLIYSVCGKRLRNFVLLLASLLFYCWGEGIYLLIMLLSILINYFCGRRIISSASDTPSKTVLIFGLVANFAILLFFKYANFLVDNLNILFAGLHFPVIVLQQMHLPIGISFFTFQAVSYIVDVYRRNIQPQRNFIRLSLYISLFPQLIAGPIVRYHHIERALTKRSLNIPDFATGVERFIFGLAKKVLLANPLGAIADSVFSLPAAELSPAVAWLGAVCYTFQIYYDFSGYSDMAIGLGRIFGFHFPENFNYPYMSHSIREFWRRWHMTLSSWFRDYLYIPLGGSTNGKLRTSINLLSVFLLCGLWHGASWTFILWGGYHGFFLVLERTRFNKLLSSIWIPVRYLLTLLIILLGWVLFRAENLSQALIFYSMMFGFMEKQIGSYPLIMLVDTKMGLELTLATLLSLPLYPTLLKLTESCTTGSGRKQIISQAGRFVLQLTLIASLTYFTVINLAIGAYNPFIYFRF